ncbi:hypothetical protein TURU_121285 [Turdus rufiventris]|nr:hypothetical protein TURU_121285 [Turdus rufiventris]
MSTPSRFKKDKEIIAEYESQVKVCLLSRTVPIESIRHWKTALRSPLSHLFARLNSTSSQPVLVGEVLQTSDHIHNPALDLHQQVPILLMLMAPGWKATLQYGLKCSISNIYRPETALPPAGRDTVPASSMLMSSELPPE